MGRKMNISREEAQQILDALERTSNYMKCTEAVFSQGRMYLDMTLMPSLSKNSDAAITLLKSRLVEGEQGAQEWQPIETAPKVGRTAGRPRDESERVVVQISHHGEVYVAFGKYTHSRASGYEWLIEGHGGDWSNRVIGWMPLPAAPQGAPK